ncbi:Tymo-45kd-70kd multi-domain protein [Pyrenophora teres f. teres]|uniref:Tymo-45kd-70kd multi-domain protein n=1 Tax=Pyrenophora teres f. teres TaxID=97479 RepID=A0A6S6VUZ0_9PLEO|nr:Tymo-45kd-70kd multi-domain protein [Pyrenophora teres f. teres]
MLAPRRPRCLLLSTQCLNVRSLRTVPRKIPTYIPIWDPTRHNSLRPLVASTESETTPEAALDSIARTEEREKLRNENNLEFGRGHVLATKHHVTRRLQRWLDLASNTHGRDPTLRAPLWRAYTLAKAFDPKLLYNLPDRAWDLLWAAQSVDLASNLKRKAELGQLYRDMVKAGKTTTVGQRVKYLETVFLCGRQDQALKEWQEDYMARRPSDRQDYKPEHLEIGAKLHALAGNVDRSREIMEELFKLYPSWNRSVMMVVFRAHTSSGLREHHNIAKDIYVKMKQQEGGARTIKDYDAWLVGFLEARNVSYAKQVFQDMVKDGYLATTGTADDVEQVLKRLHMIYRLGTDIAKMTSIALHAISVLPPAYHGHLFGDWMKSTVVQKAPQAAAQILDMMLKRGYQPETFHFNMLLKALIRTKEVPNILKAENIGWRMIEQAGKVDPSNLTPDTIPEIINRKSDYMVSANKDAVGNIPAANVTTFAMIMQHHATSLQWEHVDYLTRQLQITAIEPNATIMNVLMDNKCRQGAYAEAWIIYKALTNPQPGKNGVFPDGASFRCLWKTLRLALSDPSTRDNPSLPTPRELLKEMASWWTLSRSRYDADRFRMGIAGADKGAITSLIMHCFSYTQDLAGSLIALHVLRHRFDIFPTDKAAQILQRQMAWVDMTRDSESERSQYFHSRSAETNSHQIARVYDLLLQRRLERMNLKDGEHEAWSDEQIGDVGLNLLSEFVRVVLKRSYPPEIVEAMIDAARCAVGVPGLPTGDMDAFEVA